METPPATGAAIHVLGAKRSRGVRQGLGSRLPDPRGGVGRPGSRNPSSPKTPRPAGSEPSIAGRRPYGPQVEDPMVRRSPMLRMAPIALGPGSPRGGVDLMGAGAEAGGWGRPWASLAGLEEAIASGRAPKH